MGQLIILFNSFAAYGKENPIIAGVISLYSLGVITYFIKDLPTKLWNFLKKHLTTTITFTSSNKVYHEFIKWLHEEGYSDKLRSIKITNGRYGTENNAIKGVGYGTHLIRYKGTFIQLGLITDTRTTSDYDKDILTLTKIGRSHKVFDDIIKTFEKKKNENTINIYSFTDKFFMHLEEQPKRPMATVFIEKVRKDRLIKAIEDFMSKEEWYIAHGIPYRLGIMIHGEPRTGKTSLIRALAAYFDKDLYILPASSLYYISRAMNELPKCSFMVVEDVDSARASHKRKGIGKKKLGALKPGGAPASAEPTPEPPTTTEDEVDDAVLQSFFRSGDISDLLNAIDGITDTHGRILILTTNRKDILDPALLGPGRIDVSEYVGYANEEMFTDFMHLFFPEFKLPDNIVLSDKSVAVAKLQQEVLLGKSAEEICGKYLQINGTHIVNDCIPQHESVAIKS